MYLSLRARAKLFSRSNVVLYNDTVEDTEFFVANGKWHLLALSNTLDQPWIFTTDGNPQNPTSWLHWYNGYQVQVPSQAWNSGPGLSSLGFQHANSAFLCNAHAFDGYYYLFYSGSTGVTQFNGVGHAKIGVVRSKDLIHWQVPPGNSSSNQSTS